VGRRGAGGYGSPLRVPISVDKASDHRVRGFVLGAGCRRFRSGRPDSVAACTLAARSRLGEASDTTSKRVRTATRR